MPFIHNLSQAHSLHSTRKLFQSFLDIRPRRANVKPHETFSPLTKHFTIVKCEVCLIDEKIQ